MKPDKEKELRRMGLSSIAVLGLLVVNCLLEIFMYPDPVPIPFHGIALCLFAIFTVRGKHMLKQINDADQRENLEYLLWIHVGLMFASGLGTVKWIIEML